MRLNDLYETPVDDYVDDLARVMLTTGKFSAHGSYLDDLVDQFEGTPWWDESLSTTDILKTDEFQTGFIKWLRLRYKYAVKQLRKDIEAGNGFPLSVSRAMHVNKDWTPAGGLGIYWTIYSNPEAYNSNYSSSAGMVEIVIEAECDRNDMNWQETILSRLDYINGDQEGEIQLFKGATVYVSHVDVRRGSLNNEIAAGDYVV